MIYKLKGDSNHREIGKEIVYTTNTGYSEEFWYTSKKGSKISMNSMLFFKKIDSDEWEFQQDEDLVKVTGSDLVYSPIRDNFIYKANYSTDLRTFKSCKFNK